MMVSRRALLYGLIIVIALGGAYWLGMHQGANSEMAKPGVQAPVTESQPTQPLPPGHPAATVAKEMAAKETAGHLRGIRFAQFKVGNSNVKALLADGPLLWVGTSGGVIRYDTKSDEHRLFDVRAGLLSNGIFHLSKLGDRLVVGTYGGGLSLFDPAKESWEHFNIQHGLADAFIYDVLQADNGDIWIATWSGANRVAGGRLRERSAWSTFTVENTQGGLPNDWVYGLAQGRDGAIWMATEGGLARYRAGEWQHWKHVDGLGAPYELVKDQIAFQRDPAKESNHHARQKKEMGLDGVDVAYNPNYIVALYVAPDDTVWCGTWGGGLSRFDGQQWKTYTTADGLPSNHVFMLESAGDGALWVGTGNGLAYFDGAHFTVLNTHDGLFADTVFSLSRGEDGGLWVGGYGGVTRLEGVEQAVRAKNAEP